ncbi:fatty acyl-AMP ligase [Actinomadura opuntiae]|uniref:fatty acyl-AMP ligase n=1 Tax=Actinomadura sp. OS1-43 TaxID=604315 RepID=UPI00255A7266|nr:fatty acyl-AMP ligase [Actinomadura sp. OS1-43]MDL4814105.1 fatty acyl-AMP ligase [Actinomadura sp. OS1-43]
MIWHAATLAAANPDLPLFSHVRFGPGEEEARSRLTRAQTIESARSLGGRLAMVADPGERVAILAPEGLDYVIGFIGAMYAGCIAVPLFAPTSLSSNERLGAALRDCEPTVWLVLRKDVRDAAELLSDGTLPPPREIVPIDGDYARWGESFEGRHCDLAYLQYTSGSTRSPRGVMVGHANVIANVRQLVEAFGATEDGTCVGWLPLHHDMGLVLTVCVPLVTGLSSEFMDPVSFLKRPARWLSLLSRPGPAYTAAPNFAYDLLLRRVRPEETHVDLSGVKVFLNGSERVRAETLRRFTKAFAPHGVTPEVLRPSYGLAEATVFAATTETGAHPTARDFSREALEKGVAQPASEDTVSLVSCGRPIGQQVRIVDPGTREPLVPGNVGEIWLRGPNIAQGYWARAEESAETFGAVLDGVPGWLRTGDLGFEHDGDVFVSGRLKDLIIVDGRNHYPDDIEATIRESAPDLRPDRMAAFEVTRDGRTGVVVVAERTGRAPSAERDIRAQEARVRAAVSERHGTTLLAFHVVRPGTLKVTSSGKVARGACRRAYLAGHIAPEADR